MFKKKKEKIYKVEAEDIKKEEKAKKETSNPLHGLKFWIMTIGAAALIVLGVWILVDKNLASTLAIGMTGAAVVIFGIARIIPLIKTQKTSTAKWLITLEIILDLAIGIFMFFAAASLQKDVESGFGKFVNNYYRFFLGIVLYGKGVFYFINTSLLKEVTNKIEFWLHILVMTLGAVVFALDFDASYIAMVIAIICLICAILLIGVAGGSYFNYRKTIEKPKKKDKEIEDKKEEKETILDIPEETDRPIVQ